MDEQLLLDFFLASLVVQSCFVNHFASARYSGGRILLRGLDLKALCIATFAKEFTFEIENLSDCDVILISSYCEVGHVFKWMGIAKVPIEIGVQWCVSNLLDSFLDNPSGVVDDFVCEHICVGYKL